MNKKIILLLTISLLLTACKTIETETSEWIGVGGSKADGNVVLGIDVPPKIGVTETIIHWNIQQANTEADRRCKNWGYAGAEAFKEKSPVQKTCHPKGISPCWSKTYRIVYQCLNSK